MTLLKRLLAAGGAAGLLVGLGATPAFATSPFTATIELACANPDDTQTITVNSAANALIHIEVTIEGSTVNDGTKNGTGLTNANGTFTDQWTVTDVSTTTSAAVEIWALTLQGVAEGHGSFIIQPTTPCPSPNTSRISGSFIEATQVGGEVKKTCDAGVTGDAVFTATIHVNAGDFSTTVSLPEGLELTLACNGDSETLPKLPVGSTITLHETTRPAGAAAGADTTITMAVGEGVAVTTIHNTKAAAAVSPTPTARVLAQTGRPVSPASVPWLAIVLLGGVAAAGAGLALRRRN